MFERLPRSLLFLASLLFGLLQAGRAPAESREDYSLGVESYRELTLANGLRVVIAVDRRAPRVALEVAYEVGDALDPAGQRGLARVIGQALPWLPTRHLKSNERERLFEAAGLKFEAPLVRVRADSTGIGVEVPAEALELALWVEADRMGFAADGLTRSTLASSVERAKNERATPADESVPLAHFATLGGAHPYGASFGPDQLKDLTADAVAARIRRFYNPASAVLVVVGDVDVAATEQAIKRIFGSLASAPVPRLSAPTTPNEPRRLTLEAPVAGAETFALWATAPWFSADDLGLDVASVLLQRRLKTRASCERTSAGQVSRRLASVFSVFCAVPKQGADAWKAIVKSEILVLAEGRVSAADIEGAVLTVQRRDTSRFEEARWRAAAITWSVLAGQRPTWVEDRLKALASLDAATLSAIVRRNLLKEPDAGLDIVPAANAPRVGRVTTAHGAPSYRAPAAVGDLVTLDSDVFVRPPPVGFARRFPAPLSLDETLPNGDRLRFLAADGAFGASADLWFRFRGASSDIPAKALLGALLARRATEGSLEQTLQHLGAEVSTAANETGLSVKVRAPAKRLASALGAIAKDLFGDVLSGEELEAVKRTVEKTWLGAGRPEWGLTPTALGLSSPNSRYRLVSPGSRQKELAALKLVDLEKFLRDTVAQRLDINLSGPYDSGSARALASEFARARPKRTLQGASKASFKPGVYLVDGGSAEAVEGCILWPLPAWGAKGGSAAQIVPRYFGPDVSDGFGARLAEHHAGEPKWQTNTLLTPEHEFLRFNFRASLEQVAPILESVKDHLTRLARGHIERTDVLSVRESESEFRLRQFLSQDGLMRVLHWSSLQGRATSDAADSISGFKRLEPADLAAVAEQLLFERAILVLQGPAQQLKESLGTLGLTPTSITQAEASSSKASQP